MKRLIIFLCLLVGSTLCTELFKPAAAWAVAPIPPVSYRLGQAFSLHYGEKVLLSEADLTVTFVDVENDSRCPARVQCVVAGKATIIVDLQHGNDKVVRMAVSTDPRHQPTPENAAYAVELVALDPLPEVDHTTPVQQYVATLIVKQAAASPTASVPPTATATPLPSPTPSATQTPTPVLTPIHTTERVLTATLDAPFQLNVGQTGAIADEAFKVTLRSASSDSGCFTEDDCSTMQFDGTLALQKGDQKSLMDIMASFHDDGAFTTDFAGYTVALTSVKKLQDGSIVAVFVVSNAAAHHEAEHPAPPPAFADRCPAISKFDATALLQEAVQKQAVTNLVFGPLSGENVDVQGLCGYVSVAYTADLEIDASLPHLATTIKADHAVVAAKLTEGEQMVLLQLAEIIHTANPDNGTLNTELLKTMLAAGAQKGFLERLQAMAQGSETLHVEDLNGVAEKALWFWQVYDGGRFAALVTYDGHAFDLVMAVLGAEIDEADAQTMAMTMLQQSAPTPTPTEESPTDTPTPATPRSCDNMTQADAAAILGEPVNDEPATGDEVCGYDSVTRKPATDNETLGEPLYFAVAGTFAQSHVVDYLQSFADGLRKENPDGGILPYATIKGLLADGMIAEAFKLFPNLTKGSKTVQVQLVKGIGENALWLWGKVDGEQYATLVALDANNNISAVFARVNPQRGQANVQAKMAVVVRKLLKRTQAELPIATVTPETTRTPVATTGTPAACAALSQTDAEAILGEKVTGAPDQAAGLCGYGGVAQKLASGGKLLALQTYGVAAGILPDSTTSRVLLWVTEALHQDNPKGDANAYNKITTLLTAGMTEDALNELDKLVSGSSSWEAGSIADLGKFGVWLVKTMDTGDHLILLFAPRQDAGTVFMVAQTKGVQDKQTISNAMITVAAKLTR